MLVKHHAHFRGGGNAIAAHRLVCSAGLADAQCSDCGCGEEDDSVFHICLLLFAAAKAASFGYSGVNTPLVAKPLTPSSSTPHLSRRAMFGVHPLGCLRPLNTLKGGHPTSLQGQTENCCRSFVRDWALHGVRNSVAHDNTLNALRPIIWAVSGVSALPLTFACFQKAAEGCRGPGRFAGSGAWNGALASWGAPSPRALSRSKQGSSEIRCQP